nr:Chain C, Synthetic peptide HIS-LEU-ALA-SER-SER-GLY-HIS-SER-TYR [synthetic construct]6UZS_C Chain C, Synthetic peptide HIS-LEU-ALA-SER-SER-GLY-HIS-SER-TYR [synthetic construct]
HLASSGHSY